VVRASSGGPLVERAERPVRDLGELDQRLCEPDERRSGYEYRPPGAGQLSAVSVSVAR
jgi:hypothetical protein